MIGDYVDDNYAIVATELRVEQSPLQPVRFRLRAAQEDGDVVPLQIVQGRCLTIRPI